MSTFILIHGAWHGSWCWQKVTPLLRQAGHQVLTPDLPGRPGNPLMPTSPESYIQTIADVLSEQAEPVFLVGHSLAGTLLSAVGERFPEKIAGLIYLTAFLVPPGENIWQIVENDHETSVFSYMSMDMERGVTRFAPEGARETFYHDCSEEESAFATSRLGPEPIAGQQIPTEISEERFGRLPLFYIECTHDHAIGIITQRHMHQAFPYRHVFTLEASHSPFFSMPESLTATLLQIERAVSTLA